MKRKMNSAEFDDEEEKVEGEEVASSEEEPQERQLAQQSEDETLLDVEEPMEAETEVSPEGGTFVSEEDEMAQMEEVVDASPPKRSWVPVKKVAQVPFQKNGVLVNAVYLARPGDDLASVSTKIYGTEDFVNQLGKVNPTLVSKGLKTGDKVYHNSHTKAQ